MNTSNAFVDQKLFEELRELVKDHVSPGEAFDKILVRLWKNPKAAAIRERLRRQDVSDDRMNREVFRKILRQGRLRELVSQLQGVAMSFKAAAVVLTCGDNMEAGAVPLGIVGVAADGLVCTRPLKEFVGRAEVLASLERAGANISRPNPPASAN